MEAIIHDFVKRQSIIDESQDENVGSARNEEGDNKNSTVSGLVSTLTVNLVIFGVFLLIFVILRRTNKRIYAPRTYVSTVEKWRRLRVLDEDGDGYADKVEGVTGFSGILSWIKSLWNIPDETVLRTNGLDGYFFLRYLRKAQMMVFVGCCITYPILFPLNATGGAGQQGLDVLSYANVSDGNKNRLYAHAFLSWIFFGFILFTVYRELIFYTTMRQAYMLSPMYANRLSARTLLITTVPKHYLNETALRRIFDNIKRVWFAADAKDLEDVVAERDQVLARLEAAEVKLIKLADKARRKAGGAAEKPQPGAETGGESGSVAAKWLDRSKRPTHRLKPLVGEKVDTIDWCRAKLAELNPKIEEMQAAHRSGDAKRLSSVFIEFTSQSAAQVAFQTLMHNKPLHMAPRYIGITPDEVIWSNMRLFWWERLAKFAATTAFIVALVIFWSIPVAVVGAISNIQFLTEKVPFLRFINDIPEVILGVVTGLLPAVMLAVLMALLPIILRLMARISGCPSLSTVELRVQNSYFLFQVVQVFLVTTFSSAASTVVPKIINEPTSAPTLLAENVPKASNFYISFMILQGLSISSSAIVQLAGFIVYRVLGFLLDNTPRKQFRRWSSLAGLGWGTVFPIYTNICVIALTYSMIAPLVMAFATIGLGLLYTAYRYNFLFVYDINIDTKGLVYPRALYQTLTGVYLGEICLIGLFGIKKAFGPMVIEIVFLVFTILFHITLSSAIQPLLTFLPKNLQVEEEQLLTLEQGSSHDSKPAQSVAAGEEDAPLAQDSAMKETQKPAGFLQRYLKPDTYETYAELRKRLPLQDAPDVRYLPETERDAYYHPAVRAGLDPVWLPRDEGGVSRQEVEHTRNVHPCSDEGAYVDEKSKVRREEFGLPPGWEEKPTF